MIASSMNAEVLMLQPASEVRQARRLSAISSLTKVNHIIIVMQADSHNLPLSTFYLQAPGVGSLPQVSFVDPDFGLGGHALEDDESLKTAVGQAQPPLNHCTPQKDCLNRQLAPDSGNLFGLAQHEVAPPARVAHKAVSAVPSHAHTLTWLPHRDVSANCVHAPGNLMARHAAIEFADKHASDD
jgi:hypothetical protein